ncbi:MAG: FG-GAP repeat protein [Chitinivibrionia bacterium]|nr:FG-GAP repeat protein [Chitinivibrionia bacterium]
MTAYARPHDHIGFSISAGDINSDGQDDLIIASSGTPLKRQRKGEFGDPVTRLLQRSRIVFVQSLAQPPAYGRRRVPDGEFHERAEPAARRFRLPVGDRRVHERLFDAAPSALVIAQASIRQLGSPEIEARVFILASPLDGGPRQRIVRPEVPMLGRRGVVLRRQRAPEVPEDRASDRLFPCRRRVCTSIS